MKSGKKQLQAKCAVGFIFVLGTLMLGACGNNELALEADTSLQVSETGSDMENTKETELQEPSESTDSPASDEAKQEQVSVEQPITGDLNIKVDTYGAFFDWNADYSEVIFTGYYDTVHLLEEAQEPLKTALDAFNEQIEMELWDIHEEYAEAVKQSQSVGWEVIYDAELARADDALVSIVVEEYSYLGGAHPNTTYSSYNYDTQTGAELKLRDVVTDYDALYAYVLQELATINQSEEYKDGYMEGYEEIVKELFYPASEEINELVWTLDRQGLTLLFETYLLGSYVRGITVLEIPFGDKPEWFAEDYVAEDSVQSIYEISLNTKHSVDINGDGIEESLVIEATENEEAFRTEYRIRCNRSFLEAKHSGYFTSAHLMETDHGVYLYLENISENDFQTIYVYDLSTGAPVYVDATGNAFYGQYVQQADAFILNSRIDALGTYFAYRSYYVGADGMPVPYEKQYRIYNEWDRSLVSTVDLEVQVYDDAQSPGSYRVVTMPAGTTFEPYATDVDSYIELVLEDGTHCVLQFEREDYLILIQGMSEYDCFEMLPYAG